MPSGIRNRQSPGKKSCRQGDFLRRASAASSRPRTRKDFEMAAHDALRTILPVAGLDADRARAVEITGGTDPVLPTPFRIGETSAAALAATGLAVSDLW